MNILLKWKLPPFLIPDLHKTLFELIVIFSFIVGYLNISTPMLTDSTVLSHIILAFAPNFLFFMPPIWLPSISKNRIAQTIRLENRKFV